jgi:hypothetical protein
MQIRNGASESVSTSPAEPVKIRAIRPKLLLPPQGTPLADTKVVANSKLTYDSVKSTTSASRTRPVCDEWGVYDPEQAGFEAVLRRLSIEDDEATLALPLRHHEARSARLP